jgi:sRNA-binding carbon storage regulator CsrA
MRLVTARRFNEKLVLPAPGITVKVLDLCCGAVCLGIDAPPEASALRYHYISVLQTPELSCMGDGRR